jgi:hypothetical protein
VGRLLLHLMYANCTDYVKVGADLWTGASFVAVLTSYAGVDALAPVSVLAGGGGGPCCTNVSQLHTDYSNGCRPLLSNARRAPFASCLFCHFATCLCVILPCISPMSCRMFSIILGAF